MSELSSLAGLRIRAQIQSRVIQAFETEQGHESIHQLLRALDRCGQSPRDTQILIERERASREITGTATEEFTDGALDALEYVNRPNADTDVEAASASIYQIRSLIDLPRAVQTAFEASDLIPLGREWMLSREEARDVATRLADNLEGDSYKPTLAYFTRAPKARFASRPAALLDPSDRIIYQAMADVIDDALAPRLPETTLWPRAHTESRSAQKAFSRFAADAEQGYILHVDVESFFDYIDHSLLSFLITEHLELPSSFGKAVELLLRHMMGSTRGLPQGPVASDIFASAYLLPLDLAMQASGWSTRRYQDDILVRVDSVADARSGLKDIELALRDLGLRVATEKTFYEKYSRRRPSKSEDGNDSTRTYDIGRVRERAKRAQSTPAGPDQDLGFENLLTDFFTKDESHAQTTIKLRSALFAFSSFRHDKVPSEFSSIMDIFPILAPEVSLCLSAVIEVRPAAVVEFIQMRLETRSSQEWENSWLIIASQAGTEPLSIDFEEYYSKILETADSTPLTRALMMRVLASGSRPKKLHEGWINGLPAPLRAELLFSVNRESLGGESFNLPIGQRTRELPDGRSDVGSETSDPWL